MSLDTIITDNDERSGPTGGNPLVTCIVPTYNRAHYICETVDSILAQEHGKIELIIIDDGSTDDSMVKLSAYRDKATVIFQENRGENATVNRGFALATGEYVMVVNSDDPLLPKAISELVRALIADPEAIIAYGDWAIIGPNHEFLKYERLREYTARNMLESLNIGMGPGTLIRKTVIEAHGGRVESYRYAGDMEFWLRMSLHGRFVYIPEVLATHREHADSLSISSNREDIGAEIRDAIRRTLEDRALPENLARRKWQLMASVCDVCREYYTNNMGSRFALRLAAIRYRALNAPDPIERPARKRQRVRVLAGKALRRALFRLFDLCVPMLALFTRLGRSSGDGSGPDFTFSTRFLPPLWSGQAVVISRILAGVDPARYRLIGHPVVPTRQGADNYVGALPGKYYDLLPIRQVPVLSHNQRILRTFNLMAGVWQRAWQIFRLLRDDRPSILIGCTGDQIDPPATWLASRLLRCSFCLYHFDDYSEQWWADEVILPVIRNVEAYIAPRSEMHIAPNEYMRDAVVERYGVHCYVVRNPMPSGNLPRAVTRFPARGDTVRLLFTGAVYHLNYDVFRTIIAALDLLKDVRAELHLYTAQSHVQLRAEGIDGPRVVLHEHARPDEVARAQANADILLIPFNDDPRCRALVRTSATAKLADYLCTGRPILAICAEQSFLSSYLGRHECGVVVTGNDSNEIAAAVSRIAGDKALRDRLRVNARKRAARDFHPDVVRTEFLRLMGVPA